MHVHNSGQLDELCVCVYVCVCGGDGAGGGGLLPGRQTQTNNRDEFEAVETALELLQVVDRFCVG